MSNQPSLSQYFDDKEVPPSSQFFDEIGTSPSDMIQSIYLGDTDEGLILIYLFGFFVVNWYLNDYYMFFMLFRQSNKC